MRDSYVSETEESITEAGLRNSSARLFPKKSVIMAMYGATIGKLGILDIDATSNQACCAFILDKLAGYQYPYIYLMLLFSRDRILQLGMGAAQQNLSQAVIKSFEFIAPMTPDLTIRFCKIVDPVFEMISSLLKTNKNLRTQRDYLLPKIISGEVDV